MTKWLSKKLSNKKGFTLVEILVVILIIGILFVAFLPKIDFAGDKARETGVKASLRTYMIANEQLMRENAGLKSDRAAAAFTAPELALNVVELNKLLDASTKLKAVNGTADGSILTTATFKTLEQDPWKKEYEVSFFQGAGTARSIVVASNGKNQTTNVGDFVLVTTYLDGTIKSCTSGLNNNIGVMTGTGIAAGVGTLTAANFSTYKCQ